MGDRYEGVDVSSCLARNAREISLELRHRKGGPVDEHEVVASLREIQSGVCLQQRKLVLAWLDAAYIQNVGSHTATHGERSGCVGVDIEEIVGHGVGYDLDRVGRNAVVA